MAAQVEVHGALHDVAQLALAAQAPRLEEIEAPVVVRRLVRGRGRSRVRVGVRRWGEGLGVGVKVVVGVRVTELWKPR